MALARRGMTLLGAKRAIEALLDGGSVVVDLPLLESAEALTVELTAAGLPAVKVTWRAARKASHLAASPSG